MRDMAAEECSAADAYAAARKILGFIAEMSPQEDPLSDMAAEECSAADAYAAARKILGFIAEISPQEDPLPAP